MSWELYRTAAIDGVDLVEQFLNSPEHVLKFRGRSYSEFVDRLFCALLVRHPESPELQVPVDRAALVKSLLNGSEFRTAPHHRLTAFLLYATLLQRESSVQERDQRAAQLAAGAPLRSVIADIINSSEFSLLFGRGDERRPMRTPLMLRIVEFCHLMLAWLFRSKRWRLLFDARYYRDTQSIVRFPALHFICFGRFRGVAPHPLFDPSYYSRSNPEVIAAGWEPFAHYLRTGVLENRSPHPLVDPAYYLKTADLPSSVPALLHFLSGRNSHTFRVHPLFDPAFYRNLYADVRESGVNPLVHYVLAGQREGRQTLLEIPPNRKQIGTGVDRPPYRIVAFLSHDDAGRLDTCAYVRAVLPFGHESVADLLELLPVGQANLLDKTFDAVLVQRTAVADDTSVDEILRWASNGARKLIFELDDDLLAISETHPDWPQYRDKQGPIRRLISHADVVIVSTRELATALAYLNEHIVTLPNALDERLWLCGEDEEGSIPGEGIRALYMGTMTHSGDLPLVREAVERLGREMDFRLELVGVVPDSIDAWYDRLSVPGEIAVCYPQFVRWLKRQRRWHFGVAPLAQNTFNNAKSHLKYLDYAALGLPGVYSAVPAYSAVVEDGVSGVLTDNSSDSWYRALSTMARDAEARHRMGQEALAEVKAKYTLDAQKDLRRRVYSEIFESLIQT